MDTTKIPIVMANFRPLRFVARGEGDDWRPSLDQVNGRTYDHVKLHRLSTYLDVGVAPFSLGICFDGTLVLPATPEFRIGENALAVFNRTLSELLVGGLYCEAVAPDDLSAGTITLTAYTKIIVGGIGANASLHKAARTKHIGALDVIQLFKPEIVSVDDITSALSAGRELLSPLKDLPREQILYGVTYYGQRQWAESLIHVWTTTERLLEIAWKERIVQPAKATSKKRREFLEDHRTWTASAKLEVLFQKGLFDTEIYDKLDRARRARNDFAHRGVVPSQEQALVAIDGAFELASLCASSFKKKNRFDSVVKLATLISRREPFRSKTYTGKGDLAGATHFLSVPPIPGDEEWGEKEFEIISELCLKPLARPGRPAKKSK
jgi:hypothetical protein